MKNIIQVNRSLKRFCVLALFSALYFLFSVSVVHAATLYFLPENGEFRAGQEIIAELKVDSAGQAFNAAQATIQFSKDTLEVKSVDYSPAASIFNFWLENPIFSNVDGKITFIGGSTNGVSGKSIPILKVVFRAKGAGEASLLFGDAAITASDGSGTNILETMKVAVFKIVPETVVPKPPLPPPVLIERVPMAAARVPQEPLLQVPLYPNPEKWYNLTSDFLVSWALPADISGVSTALNDNPQFAPQTSEGLFDGKMFGDLKNGVQYLHVRFRNAAGWGTTAHYRLAIDVVPPLPFKIESSDGLKTGNPSPRLSFVTNDSISGVERYAVRVDTGDEITLQKGEVAVPLLAPGLHRLSVRAYDKAGNFTEDSTEIDIIPLPTPVVGFVTTSVSFGDPVFASGKTEPGFTILAKLADKKSQEVFSGQARADTTGNWEIIIKNPLSIGDYTLTITATDDRAALSYPAAPRMLRVHPTPVLSLGPLDLGWFEILLLTVLLVVSGTAIAAWLYVSKKKTREAYRVIVGRDVDKFYNLLSDSAKEIEGLKEPQGSPQFVRASAALSKIKETIEKLKKYLSQEIGGMR